MTNTRTVYEAIVAKARAKRNRVELLPTPPEVDVLIAWLKEAATGGVSPLGMRRLCLEAARALEQRLT